MNCIREGLIPTQYFNKTKQNLSTADGSKMTIHYKLSNVNICNQGICLNTTFVLVKELMQFVILVTPFLNIIFTNR